VLILVLSLPEPSWLVRTGLEFTLSLPKGIQPGEQRVIKIKSFMC